jgi:hypothetical protein
MNFLQQLWLRVGPFMDTIELGAPVGTGPPKRRATSIEDKSGDDGLPTAPFEAKIEGAGEVEGVRGGAISEWPVVTQWILDDILFIAMLLLALAGVIFRLPVTYWLILTPVFGLISIAEGWSHFSTRSERLGLAYRVAAIWCALLLAIYLLYNSGVQGVMNANATSLAMITLLALGTFVAGVQARVWQICAVGGILFLAVPGVGWLDQSPLLLAAATCLIIASGGLVWWVRQRRQGANRASNPDQHVARESAR